MPEDIVEDIVNPRAAGELLRGDVDVGALDGGDKVAGESGHEAEDERALLLSAFRNHNKNAGEQQIPG